VRVKIAVREGERGNEDGENKRLKGGEERVGEGEV